MSENDTLYSVGKELGEAAAAIQNAFADNGKVDGLDEIVDITKELGTLAYTGIKRHKEIAALLSDGMDENEAAQLHSGFVDHYDIDAENIEQAVEAGFEAALMILSGVINGVELLKKK